MDNTMNTIFHFRKVKTLRSFGEAESSVSARSAAMAAKEAPPEPIYEFEDKTYESVNLAKKASRKLGLGKVRNVDTLPYAPQVVV